MLKVAMLAASLSFSMSLAAPAATSGNDHLGTWRIVGSQPAPWAPGQAPYTPDLGRLLGKSVTFSRTAIAGPEPLACHRPHYEMKVYAADMLFQGSLTDPARQARGLGYVDATVTTLETGCEGAIDFHFLDNKTALFALNNRLYRLERTGS